MIKKELFNEQIETIFLNIIIYKDNQSVFYLKVH